MPSDRSKSSLPNPIKSDIGPPPLGAPPRRRNKKTKASDKEKTSKYDGPLMDGENVGHNRRDDEESKYNDENENNSSFSVASQVVQSYEGNDGSREDDWGVKKVASNVSRTGVDQRNFEEYKHDEEQEQSSAYQEQREGQT